MKFYYECLGSVTNSYKGINQNFKNKKVGLAQIERYGLRSIILIQSNLLDYENGEFFQHDSVPCHTLRVTMFFL